MAGTFSRWHHTARLTYSHALNVAAPPLKSTLFMVMSVTYESDRPWNSPAFLPPTNL